MGSTDKARIGGRSSGTPAVSARGLVYRYGKTIAVAGVDLEVAPGEISSTPGVDGKG